MASAATSSWGLGGGNGSNKGTIEISVHYTLSFFNCQVN